MTPDSSKPQRQPKLRASCDACGAAKLKCTREQPRCGRCASYDLQCQYGVSRKNGRPRRDKPRALPNPPSANTTPNILTPIQPAKSPHGGPAIMPAICPNNARHSRSASLTTADGSLSCQASSYSHDMDGNYEANARYEPSSVRNLNNSNNNNNNNTTSEKNTQDQDDLLNGLDNLFDPNTTSLLDMPDFRPNDWHLPEQSEQQHLMPDSAQPFTTMATPASLDSTSSSSSLSSSINTSTTSTTASSLSSLFGAPQQAKIQALFAKTACEESSETDCLREAYDTLGKLLAQDMSRCSISGRSQSLTASATPCNASRVPLDRVLHLNRLARERLSTLLASWHAITSDAALIFSANMSRMLTWYQEAASSLIITNPVAAAEPQTHWSRPVGDSTINVAAKMAMGSFGVDDMRVQTAMQIQLVLGEMRKLGRLIDQFAIVSSPSSSDSHCVSIVTNGHSSHVDELCKGLHSWLRAEHLRTIEILKSRLVELDADDLFSSSF